MIKENQRALNQINGLTDALILFPCMAFAYFIRFDLFHGIPGHVGLSYYMTTILCMAPLFWLMYGLMGLYDSFRSKNFLREFSLLLRSNVILFGVLLAFLFVCKQFHLSRWTLFIFFLLATVSVAVKRWMLRRVLRRFREHGYNLKHVLLVGCGEQAQAYCRAVQADRTLGFCIDHYLAPRDCLPGISYLGTYDAIANVLDRQNPDEVVIALEANEYTYLQGIIASSEKNGVKVSLIPFYNKFMPSRPAIDEIGGVSLVNLRHIPLDNIGNAFLKRAMDIIGSLILIICTSPLMLFAAVGVKLSSPGPILFKQERVGLNKKPFYMYKFRSMRVNDRQKHQLRPAQDEIRLVHPQILHRRAAAVLQRPQGRHESRRAAPRAPLFRQPVQGEHPPVHGQASGPPGHHRLGAGQRLPRRHVHTGTHRARYLLYRELDAAV